MKFFSITASAHFVPALLSYRFCGIMSDICNAEIETLKRLYVFFVDIFIG